MNILILHGWGSGSKSWLKVKELLEQKGFKVFIPDMPGFGQISAPSEPWDVKNYADWVKDFSQNNGELNQPFFLLGHSFGGRVAIKFAAQHPEKIAKLILVDSAGIVRERNLGLRQKIVMKFKKIGYFFAMLPLLRIFYPILRKIAYILAGTRDYYLIKDPIMKETFKKVIAEDLTPHLYQIKSRTLIAWGENDRLVPVADAHFINENIQGSQLEVFPKIGHNPQLECPEELVEALTKFLKQ